MRIRTRAKVLRLYVGESDHYQGRPVHEAVVELARREGMAGATVWRGIAGFGAGNLIHTARLLEVSADLPVVVEIVDRAERIDAFLPLVEEMVREGTIVVEEANAVMHLPLRVRDVMTVDPLAMAPDAPLSRVAELFLERGIKAAPVVEAGRVVGIVTGEDLLARAGMGLRLSLQRSLPPEARAAHGRLLDAEGKLVRDVMTSPAVVVPVGASVPEAARLMAAKGLKRLPVVDDQGRLVGLVSRTDVLRLYSRVAEVHDALPEVHPGFALNAAGLMIRDVPAVGPDCPLPEVLDKLVASPLRRVVVVDDRRRPLGIILDGDLVKTFVREREPGLLRGLLGRLSSRPVEVVPRLEGAAADVMEREVYSVPMEAPVADVLREMLERRVKRLAVIDAEGGLVGMADRDAILKAIAEVDARR